jgi:DNA-binding MarR family transcriptional regulator
MSIFCCPKLWAFFANNKKIIIMALMDIFIFFTSMELLNLLIKNHFSEKEAKVYLACLQLKIANVSTIARFTGEKRSTIYNIIKELQKKGIINEIDKN